MDSQTRISLFRNVSGQRVRLVAAALAGVAAVILVAPAWWGRVVLAVLRFLGGIWPAVALLAVAGLIARLWWVARPPADRRRRRPAAVQLPLFVHVGLLLVLSMVVALLIGFLLWQAFGRPDVSNAAPAPLPGGVPPVGTGRWTTQNTLDALKIVLSIVGGLGAVVALTVAYRRQQHGEAAEYREDTKLFTERFAKAAELLGDTQAAVRLAGVYAMAALADDWRDGRQSCIDVLCAYLRMPHTESGGEGSAATRDPREEREVRHTVLRLVRDHLRLPTDSDGSWRGHSFDFTGAVFEGGDLGRITVDGATQLNFSGARFERGQMSFAGADLAGGTVSFHRAAFAGGETSFETARFSDGDIDFGGAAFAGGDVSFAHAEFSGGSLSFEKVVFSAGNVSFEHAVFSGGGVSFEQAEFSGGVVSFEEATIPAGQISLDLTDFSGGEVSFTGVVFEGGAVSFRQASFSGAQVLFEGARFEADTVSFVGAEFSAGDVSFAEAEFTGSDVSFLDAEFSGGAVSFADSVVPEDAPEAGPAFDPALVDNPPPGLRLPPQPRAAVRVVAQAGPVEPPS
ncbi:hypothetical protein [Asanoa sp. NPDC050611]|uniref:hypothetical protein n=1 Tax=Asanoa sp. NPDC050611 TaxID=3157098 RepID=UPI0033F424A9